MLHRGMEVVAAIEVKLGLSPKLAKGFYEAHKDLKEPKSWVIYSGTERYPLAPKVEAIGLEEFIKRELPKL